MHAYAVVRSRNPVFKESILLLLQVSGLHLQDDPVWPSEASRAYPHQGKALQMSVLFLHGCSLGPSPKTHENPYEGHSRDYLCPVFECGTSTSSPTVSPSPVMSASSSPSLQPISAPTTIHFAPLEGCCNDEGGGTFGKRVTRSHCLSQLSSPLLHESAHLRGHSIARPLIRHYEWHHVCILEDCFSCYDFVSMYRTAVFVPHASRSDSFVRW